MSKVTLEMEFPSQEHLDAFTGWLSNSGEQDHYQMEDYVEKEEKHLFRCNFDYSQNNKIVVTEYPEEV